MKIHTKHRVYEVDHANKRIRLFSGPERPYARHLTKDWEPYNYIWYEEGCPMHVTVGFSIVSTSTVKLVEP